MDEGIETARLSVAEIDDQAIAEIGDLIGEPACRFPGRAGKL
ncbi:hypothetical protein [Phenylobacterium sp.]